MSWQINDNVGVNTHFNVFHVEKKRRSGKTRGGSAYSSNMTFIIPLYLSYNYLWSLIRFSVTHCNIHLNEGINQCEVGCWVWVVRSSFPPIPVNLIIHKYCRPLPLQQKPSYLPRIPFDWVWLWTSLSFIMKFWTLLKGMHIIVIMKFELSWNFSDIFSMALLIFQGMLPC